MHTPPRFLFLILLLFPIACAPGTGNQLASEEEAEADDPFVSWGTYGGDKQSRRYSRLDQINRSNVDQLEVAWTHHTGDLQEDRRSTMEGNPIIVDGVLYITTPTLKAIALDAATGERIWTFDPFEGDLEAEGVNRGVAYWESEDGTDKRILYTAGWTPRLYALDAETGQPIEEFGDDGVVDFGEGIRQEGHTPISATSPGIVYEDLLILGTRIPKGPYSPAGQGDVAAYDVRTGERKWLFHTIPHPGEFGHETWEGDSWKTEGGANPWGGFSLDEERGWVFLPVTTPGYSFYGGTREGKNLFSNSLVVLDADTGERIWHYQLIHHGIWDRDLGAPPVLATITHEGEEVEVAVQASKRGDLFVLNRETGEPVFPVEERAVPPSDVPGEKAWPTQPFPSKPAPFSRQGYDRADLPERSDEARSYALERFSKMRKGERFIPPSMQGTILLPGLRGGAHWGGAAFDPTTGMLYINDTNVPWIMKMEQAQLTRDVAVEEDALPKEGAGKKAAYPYVHTGYNKFIAPDGYPAIKPPWGTLNAIDLNTGEIVWDVPLGEYEELTEQGMAPTGTDNLGGPIVTAGGLVFIAASKDEKIRAFDKKTGDILWEAELPAGGYAVPSTYEVNGKQYVVIAAGGGGLLGTEKGDAIVAFALPDEAR